MQSGLINHGAGKNGVAIICQGDGQVIKPVHPLLTQVALKPDLVNSWCIWIGSESAFVGHNWICWVVDQRYEPNHNSPMGLLSYIERGIRGLVLGDGENKKKRATARHFEDDLSCRKEL